VKGMVSSMEIPIRLQVRRYTPVRDGGESSRRLFAVRDEQGEVGLPSCGCEGKSSDQMAREQAEWTGKYVDDT